MSGEEPSAWWFDHGGDYKAARWRPVHFLEDGEGERRPDSWTISPDAEEGWVTDCGCPGYGLPLEVAQWICDVLNSRGGEA